MFFICSVVISDKKIIFKLQSSDICINMQYLPEEKKIWVVWVEIDGRNLAIIALVLIIYYV